LYFAAPYTGGAAWKVFAYETSSAVTQELFTIENGTPKFLDPKLSPDGQWIAYRGRDNSSVYLVHPDGSGMRLLADSLGATGIEWSRSGWLGISLAKQNSSQSKTILLKPDSCEIYQLPEALHGDLQGLYLP
jgi:Tol biopolymer transport system component